jgi:hypothetical protein
MLTAAVFAVALTSTALAPQAAAPQPIGDAIRRVTNETEKFYGKQWQMVGETLRVALLEPGERMRFSGAFTTETVSFTFAGQNNTTKFEMNIVDPVTKKVLEKAESDSLGSIYFMPKKNKPYLIELVNMGNLPSVVAVTQVVGGLGAQLPLSKYKFLASSSGHALWDGAAAGEISITVNTTFFKAAVVPAKGTFVAALGLGQGSFQVIGYGDTDTLKLKAELLDKSSKVLATLTDDGSGARLKDFPNGSSAVAKIRFTNPTSKRVVYSWAVVNKN